MTSCGVSRRYCERFQKPNEKRIIREFDLMEESSLKGNEEVRPGRKSVNSGNSKRAAKRLDSGAGGKQKRRRRSGREICFDEGGVKRASKENTAAGSGTAPETSTSGRELELEKPNEMMVNEWIIVTSSDNGSVSDENWEKMNLLIIDNGFEDIHNCSATEEYQNLLVHDPSPLENFDCLLSTVSTEDIISASAPEDRESIREILKDIINDNLSEEVLDFPSQQVHEEYVIQRELQEAIIKGSLSEVNAALCKGDYLLNGKNHNGQTPLHLAVIYGEKEIVRLLIKQKADISVKDEQGNTALHLSIRRKEDDFKLYGCFKILIESEDIEKIFNTLNNQGFSPLHTAAIYGAYEEARCMLNKGAEVDLKDGTSGRTALFHAVEDRNVKLANLLLISGADIHAKNMSRQTPYMAAKLLGKANEPKKNKSCDFNKYMYFYAL